MTKRISCILQQIKPCNIVFDIGSDHAQVAINLLQNNIAKHVVNTDIAKKPLTTTIHNLQNAGLIKKTTNIHADGLQFSFHKPIDYCVIAGLGSHTITNILTHANKHLKINKYIIVSNNKPEIIRFWLKTSNWKLENEQIIYDKNVFYFLFVVSKKGLIIKTPKDIYIGVYLPKRPSNELYQWIHQELIKLDKIPAMGYNNIQLVKRRLFTSFFRKTWTQKKHFTHIHN
ncbi:MAG: class I SAM-dependent methyltransferase [Mycoplasmataceae bacterium]|nr:class I SAM-dependent methyltransferase [Mycoplasmataceae bacterium]